ncbi:MAG TPA: hypothetical protein VMJ94_06685 [Nitrososphaera sp.]|nr:hypothetical protein [Nitrososphaera sp.]
MMSYPTQEGDLRAKEAQAEDVKNAEEARFLSAFRGVPKRNGERLAQLANAIAGSFNAIMSESRQKPYERQEDIMAGMKKLFQEQINVIEARRAYTVKINPSTALKED